MTEPAVASSDATNIACDVRREGDMYVINGRKWWSSGAMDPRCKVCGGGVIFYFPYRIQMSHAGHAAAGRETQPLSESIFNNTSCYRRDSLGVHFNDKTRDELTLFICVHMLGSAWGAVPHVWVFGGGAWLCTRNPKVAQCIRTCHVSR